MKLATDTDNVETTTAQDPNSGSVDMEDQGPYQPGRKTPDWAREWCPRTRFELTRVEDGGLVMRPQGPCMKWHCPQCRADLANRLGEDAAKDFRTATRRGRPGVVRLFLPVEERAKEVDAIRKAGCESLTIPQGNYCVLYSTYIESRRARRLRFARHPEDHGLNQRWEGNNRDSDMGLDLRRAITEDAQRFEGCPGSKDLRHCAYNDALDRIRTERTGTDPRGGGRGTGVDAAPEPEPEPKDEQPHAGLSLDQVHAIEFLAEDRQAMPWRYDPSLARRYREPDPARDTVAQFRVFVALLGKLYTEVELARMARPWRQADRPMPLVQDLAA
jgi:hypothetical protein